MTSASAQLSSDAAPPPGWQFLLTPEGAATLDRAEQLLADGTGNEEARSFAANSALRRDGLDPAHVAAALAQALLRRKAVSKFGEQARHLLFTPAGLEQATRLEVARLHAKRFRAAGCTRIADLGCGIGAESLAFAAAGLGVLAVERDPFTAAVAAHNLRTLGGAPPERFLNELPQHLEVLVSDAESAALSDVDGAFLDPARRTSGHSDTRRLASPDDYSPSLDFAFGIAARMPTGIKLGPGLDHELIPEEAEAQWVSTDGQLVEVGLWFGAAARAGVSRSALVLRDGAHHEMAATGEAPNESVRPLGEYLYEPDGAVIRARLIGRLARQIGAGMLHPDIAYLTSDTHVSTPFAQGFRIIAELPVREKDLRRELAHREIGSLEIKKRGADVDPATLRKRLKLRGPNRATLIISRTPEKRLALLAERC
ncbi:THUMP-like domain-containing protein [Leucobacter sp. GX24907]